MTVPDTADPSTLLQVRGIAFTGGHTSTALNLRGGSGHLIQGNAFGGVRPGSNDALGNTNLSHVIVRANAQDVTIGGPNAEDRNVFGGTQTSSAIVLRDSTSGGHLVRNNYIGLDPGGAIPQAIGNDGIAVIDSAAIEIVGNVIDAGSTGISISGANAGDVSIRGNRIGIDAYGGEGALDANDYGIVVYNLASNVYIGSYDAKAASNTIANNNFSGVWVEATAGSNNSIRPNSIYDNGRSGSGLGIDLGGVGPLDNDAMDADTGPNGSQNSPRVKASAPNPDGSRTVSGKLNSTPSQSFRIDVYRSPTCPGGNRGGSARTLLNAPTASGATDVTTDANGVATFSAALSGVGGPSYLTAVATSIDGNSSEIGACFLEDTIFKSGVETELL